jgi:serine/threonine protein kinase
MWRRAKERNVDTNGFSDMSAPLCYTAPEVLQMERCGATWSPLAAGNAASDAAASQGESTGSSSAAATAAAAGVVDGSPGARSMWDTSKSDVWQIGTIAFMLLSGGVPSHPYFAAAGSAAAEFALRRDDMMMIAGAGAEAMTAAEPMMSPGRACTSPRLDFTGDCWLDVSESGKAPSSSSSSSSSITDQQWSIAGRWSASAKCFLVSLLANDPAKRPTARQALRHPWLVRFPFPFDLQRPGLVLV